MHTVQATDYFVNSAIGSDEHPGTSAKQPFRSVEKINRLSLKPGDRVLFAATQVFSGELRLVGVQGLANNPIVVSSYHTGNAKSDRVLNFSINAKGKPNGVLIEDCSYIIVKHATIEADGYEGDRPEEQSMRVGVMINASPGKICRNIHLDSLEIKNIYFENKGFVRNPAEVKTENGTQRYGWGIRLMATQPTAQITQVEISHCRIRDVSHTGIKLTGANKNIHWIRIYENDIAYTGGPGMQMSEVKNIHVHHNAVDHSGSNNDSRKWGRGSGLWTWSASEVLIEHNSFTNANGPGDSAGAHVDYNCDHVVLQYNFSARNAGGFCEILGNNYNCAYRYNVSVNDGHRIKGENGAFQEGKIFWLSGYQGNQKPRKGPVNSYFYNNTIFVDSSITARVAIDGTSRGILIANNIFCIMGRSKTVLGDQYKADDGSSSLSGPVLFENNLWYSANSWPSDAGIKDASPKMGIPLFKNPGGLRVEDYVPGNSELIKGTGIKIEPLSGDFLGLLLGMNAAKDILGKPIGDKAMIGAIMPE
jgi:Right handed beta helix region